VEPFSPSAEETRLFGRANALRALGRSAESQAALRDLEARFPGTDPADNALVHACRGDRPHPRSIHVVYWPVRR